MMRPEQRGGALGMKYGDRIVYEIDGRAGTAGEFMQDGDVDVAFDDGTHETVKWNHCRPENNPVRQRLTEALREGKITPNDVRAALEGYNHLGNAVHLRRRRESIRAEEVLEWMRSRPGASWIASINDIEHALDELTK